MNIHNVSWKQTAVTVSTQCRLKKKIVLEKTVKIKILNFKNLIWPLIDHVGFFTITNVMYRNMMSV